MKLFIMLLSLTCSLLATPVNEQMHRAPIVLENNVTVVSTQRLFKVLVHNPGDNEILRRMLDDLDGIVGFDTKRAFKRISTSTDPAPVTYRATADDTEKIKAVAKKYGKKVVKQEAQHTYAFDLISVSFSGEYRLYPQGKRFLSPFLGYNRKYEKEGITYLLGTGGIEAYYNEHLSALGKPEPLVLHINLTMQEALEHEMDLLKQNHHAEEATSVILEPETMHIKAIASSNRYTPDHITRPEFSWLQPSIIQHLFEPAFLMYPIILAIAEERGKSTEMLDEMLLMDYLKQFGFNENSGIDLANERTLELPESSSAEAIIDGKAFKVNLMQLLKAYSVFYNDGKIGTPRIAEQDTPGFRRLVRKETAHKVRSELKDFYAQHQNEKFVLDFGDHVKKGSIIFEILKMDDTMYLKATFIIEK